jgi:FtsP/CotA-like multicopper oxidase with cupredoxin domain
MAGIGHLAAIPAHGETLPLWTFFVTVGILQLVWSAAILLRSSRKLYLAGISSSLLLLGLYGITRFVALPFGHHTSPEPVELSGLLVKAAEAALLLPAVYILRASGGRQHAEGPVARGPSGGRRAGLAILLIVTLLIGFVAGAFAVRPELLGRLAPPAPTAAAENVREYTLVAEVQQFQLGEKTWEGWTYNGTVPGPTLRGKVGDVLRVKLINRANLIHSVHTHLTNYPFESDGSQANVITGRGSGAMVPPGGEYVYEYPLTTPGLYFYHCHSSDGGNPISTHIHKGLYGAIIVDEPDRAPAQEFVLFYSEGQPGSPTPYVIDNRGIPGGEMVLEEIFREQGFDGVAAQLNVTVTALQVRVGDVVRLHVINIGDLFHSHHHHGFEHRSVRTLRGDVWAANVLPLVPGQADTLEFTATQPGVWLFHCHVVNHADAGMIGVLIVED